MAEEDADQADALQFASRCLALDLEVGKADSRIHQLGAIRYSSHTLACQELAWQRGDLGEALDRLDAFATGSGFVLGHNYLNFDRAFLATARGELRLLRLPALDSLWLNPLAFPRNPYHHLVKHYQDGKLRSGERNNPLHDARLALEVLADQFVALRKHWRVDPQLVTSWHFLTSQGRDGAGFDALFRAVRGAPAPDHEHALGALAACIAGRGCSTTAQAVVEDSERQGWPLAYALAWLSVAGGNSVVPPWVRHQFPEVSQIIRRLRDRACGNPSCQWCSERHDPTRELTRWFPGLAQFRPEPADGQGNPLQRSIVQAAMRNENVLGILPTGTGKSICYQIPALSRFDKTGALTVVISPLVALMEDQVNGLMARGISCAAAINGLLSMPERAAVLERVRLGDIGILIVSPEQLRNRTLRNVLAQREIGAWVLDEAHCISKWGHDFRPDYRYVGRFIREKAGDGAIPPIMCLTATAKPDVVKDMIDYFASRVGVGLALFDGGASRSNLSFSVVPTTALEKFAHVLQVLNHELPPDQPGGAIVYCATRKHTEDIAKFLQSQGIAADCFHAGLAPLAKKEVQNRFIAGELRVITATNAFGMGIDKPDVRLVVHADIPGSLENYLQEAGRAGRDRGLAKCVLLYTPDDVERQFGMSARSRLTQREIQAVLKALRKLDKKKKGSGEVIATSGEILKEDERAEFERDSATDDTRVRTAVAWLEEAQLLQRDENLVSIFPSSLKINSLDAARQKLATANIFEEYRTALLKIVQALIEADKDEGISTDALMGLTGLGPEAIRKAMHDLETMGLASNDMALTAFVHVGVADSSLNRLRDADLLERDLIEAMRLNAPDMGKGDSTVLQVRHMNQFLKDQGHAHLRPDQLRRILRGLAEDGRGEGGVGSLQLRSRDSEHIEVTLQREWSALSVTAERRRLAAQRLLEHLVSRIAAGSKGKDLLAESTLGELERAMLADLELKALVRDPARLLERALMWLHEQEVLRLNKGLAVFRPAMTIRLDQGRKQFSRTDFTPLQTHYDEQVIQIHVMDEYVQRGLKAMADALRLAAEYFHLPQGEFLRRWLPDRDSRELRRQTTPESWRSIVESLGNPVQQDIVADEREQTNVLVLAGPGSGKTRVLVHRIAWLLRVRREKPEGILALAYNRHAAVEIRRRLRELIGDDAHRVLVMTCHALAMRLAGVSFTRQADALQPDAFRQVLLDAVALLKGEGLPPDEADEQRDRLLAGFRWILVDEYQDIGPEQYDLISALAGRQHKDAEGKNTILAVGDDDQNIYAFNGASVDYIRRFGSDYDASPSFLLENYRSTGHIVGAANAVISPGANRMKADHPLRIDRKRRSDPPGAAWAALDPVGQGRVQLLRTPLQAASMAACQAEAVMSELTRLQRLDPGWSWARCAVIAREWQQVNAVRAWCECHGVPVQMANEDALPIWRLRETQMLVAWVRSQSGNPDLDSMRRWIGQQPHNPWWELIGEALDAYLLETGAAALPGSHFLDWLAEWGREVRRRQSGLLLLTAHRAKGLEFDHVAILDGGWSRDAGQADPDETRRLFYVAMTRARFTLLIAECGAPHRFSPELRSSPHVVERTVTAASRDAALERQYLTPSLRNIDLGFAGRYPATHPLHAWIAELQWGDALELAKKDQSWLLLDGKGRTVGRMARGFVPPAGMACVQARVSAVLDRAADMVDASFRHQAVAPQWEVVVPELVFCAMEPAMQ